MTSTILNFIFDKFLSNFLEIDTSKTDVSIFNGLIEFENLKIKNEVFQNYNLPYLELVHGYVGNMHIEMNMPFFYNHPIKVIINKIFFHARQKNINNLQKKEELKNLLEYKKKKLLNTEQLYAEIDEVKKQNKENAKRKIKFAKDASEDAGLIEKIINNILIEINDVVFRFDDSISYKEVPFSFTIILNRIIVRSTKNDYEIPKNLDEVIPFQEINYKVAIVENFSVYMDCFDVEDDLNFERLISPKVSKAIKSDLSNYLKDQLGFYVYCMSELYVHSKKFDSHQYLLYQLHITVKISLNSNLYNKKPQISINADFPQILLSASFKQIRTLLKVLAYVQLNSLFQKGIAKEYFNRELKISEKKDYVDGYEVYFRNKYVRKRNIEFPSSLKYMEEHIDYNQISEMREYALEKMEFVNKLEEIEDKINFENLAIIKNDAKLKSLNQEKERILRLEENFTSTMFSKTKHNALDDLRQDELAGLEDTYVKLYLTVNILMTTLTIYEMVAQKEKGGWEFKNKLILVLVQNLSVEGKIQKVGIIFLFTLENIIISQEKIKNPNYSKIFFGDLTTKGKILYIIFEINPKLKKSNLRCKVWSDRQVYIIINIYTILYIVNHIVDLVMTTIDLEELSLYTQESVLKYIREGIENKLIPGNFSHANIALDVSLTCPLILVPIDVFDYNNTNCMLLSLGELKLKSVLPQRVELNQKVDYTKTTEEYLMYDIYRINLIGTRISTVENCIERNNYVGKETLILKDLDFMVECKILIQPKNPNFDNVIVNIIINQIDFQMTEFQILLIIEFLGNYFKEGYKLKFEMANLKEEEEKIREARMKEEELKKILKKHNRTKKEEEIENENIKRKEEIAYNERKKKAALVYKQFIKSYSMSSYRSVLDDIKRIVSNKKSVLVNIILKHVRFAIQKNYPDHTVEDYLVFEMTLLKVDCDISESGLVVRVFVKNVALYDFDKDEEKNHVINKYFQCLIESAYEDESGRLITISGTNEDKNVSFIEYQLLLIGNEINNIVNINNLHILVSLESLLHMYQFSMYYVYVLLDTMKDAEIIKNMEIEKNIETSRSKNEKNIKEIEMNRLNDDNSNILNKYTMFTSNAEYLNNIKQKKMNNNNNKNKFKNIQIFQEYLKIKFNDIKKKNETFSSERYRKILTVLVELKNTKVKLPFDPKKYDSPIFKVNFDLTYNQNSTYVYTDFYSLPSRTILGTFYEYNTSSMNTSVSKCDMDMVYYIASRRIFTSNIPEERIISNFRMSCLIDSFIVLNNEQRVMIIDVNTEPILFAFGMRQFRRSWDLYKKSMNYLSLMWEKYIPYAKPGIVLDNKKKRKSLKDLINKVIRRQNLKRDLKRKLKLTNKKKVLNTIINIDKFNFLLITNVKSDKIAFVFFDNTYIGEKTILLDVKMKKLICKYLQNSIIKDKENISFALYEMLTGDEVPINKYNKNTLSMYYFVFFQMQANYYNILTNNFEPVLERFEMSVEMMQVAPFFKARTYVIVNDIVNFNLSADSIIALNSFMLRYSQNEQLWDLPKELINPLKWRSTFQFTMNDLKMLDKKDEIILQFLNYTGLDLEFFFDSYPQNKIQMKSKEIVSFTSENLYKARGLHKRRSKGIRTTFSVSLKNTYPIESINYKRTNYKQYKLKVESNNNKYESLYFYIKVESSYILNKVYFSSSICFYNSTKFNKIIIFINNDSVDENLIVIMKDSKEYIPLTWFLCEPPKSSIFLKFPKDKKSFKICDHVSEFIHKISDENTLKERENSKKHLEKAFSNIENPKLKKVLEIKKIEVDNNKNSKYLDIIHEGKKGILNLDYYILQSKNIKNELNLGILQKEKTSESMSKTDSYTSKDILDSSILSMNSKKYLSFPELDYEYVIFFRPAFFFVNKMPFTLFILYKNYDLTIEPLKKYDLYEYRKENINDDLTIKIDYNGIIFSSNPFKLLDIFTDDYIDLFNENTQLCLKCHILKYPMKKEIKKPRNYFLEIKEYSINTYEIIFFFDFIINNRLTKTLWFCPCKIKMKKLLPEEINLKKHELKPTSLNILSFPDHEPQFSIKDDSSNWSAPFNINTVGIQGSIELDNISNSNISLNSIKEIAVIISSSDLYEFSIIILFEPKYIIINNLGFDIVYKQENNSLNKEFLLRKSEYHSLIYEKINKYFKIGIYDEINHVTNYSGLFDIENVEDLDLKIKVNPYLPFINKNTKIFSYDGREYYILIRVINHTYDNGTVYLLFDNPLFPYLEIVNNLKVPLKIYEKSSSTPLLINNPKFTNFPFAWENPAKYQDELEFEIYNKREKFTFSLFNEKTIYIKEKNLYITYSITSKNKTETRCFKIDRAKQVDQSEINLIKMFMKRKKLSSSIFDCFIKGFGLSLITQDLKEKFYISFYNINFKYLINVGKNKLDTKTTTTMNYIALIENFQVDYCLNDSLKTMISPKLQIVPSNEIIIKKMLKEKNVPLVPFMSACVTMKTIKNLISNEELTSYELIQVILQKFELKMEHNEFINLFNMYNEFMQLFDYYTTINNQVKGQDNDKEPLLDIELPIPIKKLMKENQNSFRQLINHLALSELKFEVTLRLDTKPLNLKIPPGVERILGSILNALGRISNCPLAFSQQILENIYMSWYDLTWKIINSYITQGIVQIYKILGSLDIIGNPVNLINNITHGVYDFVAEPGEGIQKRNGLGIGKGLAKGVGGLVSGVVGGAFDSLQRITTTLLVSIQTITGRKREDILYEEQNEPDNVLVGFYEGIIGFGSEIKRGIYNLFTQPCIRYQELGTPGFFRGLCKGLIGVALSPFSAVLKFVSSFAAGIKNSVFGLSGKKKLKTERFRYPRIIVEGEEKLHTYDESRAEAKEILFDLKKEYTDNILYAEDFICADHGFGRKFSTCILTDQAIYVVYNTSKIIFEELVKNIKNVSIHFFDDKFVIAFKVKDGKSRGFSINKYYSKIPTELYDLLTPIVKRTQTMLLSSSNSGIFIKEYMGQVQRYEEDIDISSYGTTLTHNTCNSLKTLESKL